MTYAEFAIAYNTELVLSRRLQKNSGLPEPQALVQILLQAAAGRSLDELVQARRELQRTAERQLQMRRDEKAAALERRKRAREPDASSWQAWFDSSVYPNPGRMGIGGVLKSPDGQVIQISRAAGYGSSSEGEYLALIAVLQEAVHWQPDRLVVFGDSQIVINDVLQAGAAGARGLEHYRAQAKGLMGHLRSVALSWIPRHRNMEADALSQRARQAAAALANPGP